MGEKLNQQKVESMENLHLQFSKCRKVTMHKYPCINVLNTDTWKTRDPNFEGVSNLKFSIQSIFTKWQPFFKFFIMADIDIPFPLTLGKPETQFLGEASNLKFFHMIDIYEMAAIFQFFHNGLC